MLIVPYERMPEIVVSKPENCEDFPTPKPPETTRPPVEEEDESTEEVMEITPEKLVEPAKLTPPDNVVTPETVNDPPTFNDFPTPIPPLIVKAPVFVALDSVEERIASVLFNVVAPVTCNCDWKKLAPATYNDLPIPHPPLTTKAPDDELPASLMLLIEIVELVVIIPENWTDEMKFDDP